jgi:hypothetical protein
MYSFDGSVAIAGPGAAPCHARQRRDQAIAVAASHARGGKSVRSKVA